MRHILPLLALLTISGTAASAAPQQNSGTLPTSTEVCTDGATGYLQDEDGNYYKAACIGGRYWMTENLRLYSGSYAIPGNDSANYAKYGLLYDWETARSICPKGWLLPTKDNYAQLFKQAGADDKNSAGLRDSSWQKGNNSCNFSAIPAGYSSALTENGGGAANFGAAAYFWTSTQKDDNRAFNSFVRTNKAGVHHDTIEHTFFSVRCIQDPKIPFNPVKAPTQAVMAKSASSARCANGTTATMTDNDQKTYKTVCINGLTWMAENIKKLPTRGKYYHVNNDAANDATYGLLYDWKAARSVCPADQGWRLPSDKEFEALLKFVGDNEENNKSFMSLTAKSPFWKNFSNQGVNDSGFGALPAGSYFPERYREFGIAGQWWSSASKSTYEVINLYLFNGTSSIVGSSPDYGLSVRCVKD